MKTYRSKKAQQHIIETYDALLNLWGIPVTERMVATRYGGAHVTECGCEGGKPLVLFHGVGDNSALMWVFNAAALGEYFHLYAVDTIGGPGKSTYTEAYNKSFDDVLWIDDVLDGLKLDRVCVAGVSNGGYMVQLYTLFRGERVEKAISMAASVPVPEEGSTTKMMMKIFMPEALFPTKKNIVKLIKKLAGVNYKVFMENDTVMAHYLWLLKGFNPMAMTYHKVRSFSQEEIDCIRDRVYYLVGREDPFEKRGGAKALADQKMHVKFYDDVGHGINHEAEDRINNEIIQYLLSPEPLCEQEK